MIGAFHRLAPGVTPVKGFRMEKVLLGNALLVFITLVSEHEALVAVRGRACSFNSVESTQCA
jgi:hypothetical protein